MATKQNTACARTDEVFTNGRALSPHGFYSSECKEPIEVRLQAIGRTWMDFLTPAFGHSPLVCSERVFCAIQEAKLTGYKGVAVKLRPPPGKRIVPPLDYFWLIPIAPSFKRLKRRYVGSQQLHEYKFAFESNDPGDAGFRQIVLGENEAPYDKMIPLINTWDGSDFSRFTEEQPTNIMGSMFCSRRVLDLAAREKWTNIQFVPVDALEPMSIDFLKGPWPPVAWYSKYEPE